MFKQLLSAFFIIAAPLLADLPTDPAVRVGDLENGISYYVQHHREKHVEAVDDLGASNNRAALRLVVPIGSVQEEEGEEGLAHWIEHLMFRGTRSFSRGDIINFLSSIGASIGPDANAYTSFDQTVYELEVPVDNPDHLVTAIQLMSEWVSCATLRDYDIEAERQIVIEERRGSLGARLRLSEQAVPDIFADSKYAERLPIGLLETLESATPETIRNFYQKWYPQVPVAVVAVGDFDVDTMETLIIETFGSLSDRMPREEIPSYPVPASDGSRFLVCSDPEVSGAMASLLFKLEPRSSTTEEDLRADLVANLARGMLNGRLRTLSVGDRCGADAYTVVKPLEIFDISAECRPDHAFLTLGRLTTEISRLQLYGFTDGELDRAARELLSLLTLDERASIRRSCSHLAEAAVDHYLSGTPLLSTGYRISLGRSIVPTISIEEVNEFIQTLNLHENNLVMVMLPKDATPPPMAEKMLRVAYGVGLQAATEPFVDDIGPERLLDYVPDPGAIASETFDPNTGRTSIRFENGLTLHLLPNNNDEGMLVFTGVALGGLSDFEPHHLPTARLVEPLVMESGIGPHSNLELSRLLTGQQVSFARSYDTYSRSVYGAGTTEEQEALLQLIHLSFTSPSTNRDRFEDIRRQAITCREEAQRDPEGILRREVKALNHSDHPYFAPSTIREIQLADYLLADAIACKDFSNPAEFTFVFVGDFDLPSFKRLAATYLGSIPVQPELRDTYRPLDDQFPGGAHQQHLYHGKEDKSVVQLTFPISVESASADQLDVVDAAANVIGGRIHGLMRGALSATYNVRARAQFLYPETSNGLLSLRFVCDPQDADLLSHMALRELRILKSHGPTTEEVTHLTRNHRRAVAENLHDNGFLAHEVARHTLHQWDLAGLAQIPERVHALSKQALAEQIRNMLPLDNYTCVILFPEVADKSQVS